MYILRFGSVIGGKFGKFIGHQHEDSQSFIELDVFQNAAYSPYVCRRRLERAAKSIFAA